MMYQGLYGAFPFTVAEAEVRAIRDFKLSRVLASPQAQGAAR